MVHKLKMSLMGLALVGAGVAVGGEAALAFQGHMFAAQNDLQAARQQLSVAIPDKAGHRINALNLVNQALGEVNAGIGAGSR